MLPQRILEVGSGEGLIGLWFCSRCKAQSLTSVDAWRKKEKNEKCFDTNRQLALSPEGRGWGGDVTKEKGDEILTIMRFLETRRVFDFIVVAGGREGKDVLFIATAAVRLLPLGGVLMLRDYSNSEGQQYTIDSFAASHEELLIRVYCGEDDACFRRLDV